MSESATITQPKPAKAAAAPQPFQMPKATENQLVTWYPSYEDQKGLPGVVLEVGEVTLKILLLTQPGAKSSRHRDDPFLRNTQEKHCWDFTEDYKDYLATREKVNLLWEMYGEGKKK